MSAVLGPQIAAALAAAPLVGGSVQKLRRVEPDRLRHVEIAGTDKNR